MPGEREVVPLLCGQVHVRRDQGDDERIAAIASAQHGVAGRRQLLAAGVGKRAIEHRIEMGRLRPLFRGVYAVGHEAAGFRAHVTAAIIAASAGPARVAASHLTAAALWGLIDHPGGTVHVSVERQRRAGPGMIIHRAVLPADEVAEIDGLPVTSAPRTLLDLSGTLAEARLRRIVRDAEFRRLVNSAGLAAILRRYPYRRGRRPLARIVESVLHGGGRTRSELEDRFLAFCSRHGIPPPDTNVIADLGGVTYELDCAWPPERVVVELDGYAAHGGRLAFQGDRARDRRLAAAGWLPRPGDLGAAPFRRR